MNESHSHSGFALIQSILKFATVIALILGVMVMTMLIWVISSFGW